MQVETRERISVLAGFSAIACFISLYLGQDANFDLLNYHLHNAWALTHHRWRIDQFAAGIHSYFSPLLDIPYYQLLHSVIPDHLAMLVALSGLPYGILLFFIYLISNQLAIYLNVSGRLARCCFIGAAVCLGGCGAATWSQIGTTTNEITIGIFALAAFYQLLVNVCYSAAGGPVSSKRNICAGALLGAAAGLKMTAVIYAPGSAIVILLMSGDLRKGIKQAFMFCVSWIVLFLIVYGFWGWHLYEMTGNPFFPLFNNIFHSDWMASSSWRDVRFIPRSFLEWVFYPFFWLPHKSTLIAESPFRDGRFAFAYVGIALWCFGAPIKSINIRLIPYVKPIKALVIFILVAYVVWLWEFSILRYAVAIECLSSIFLVSFVVLIVRDVFGRPGSQAVLSAIFLSFLLIAWTRFPQWGRVPAGENILKLQVPPIKDGSLVVFADNPMAFLALPLSKRSHGLRFIGLPRDFAKGRSLNTNLLGHRLGRLLHAEIVNNNPNINVMFYVRNTPPDESIAPLGLELDLDSCQIGRSAISEDFYVCKAHPLDSIEAKNRMVAKFKLVARETSSISGAMLDFKWTKNDCAEEVSNGSAEINWMSGSNDVFLYVTGPHSDEDAKLMVEGGPMGTVKTDQWINAGQRYILKNASGQQLADVDIGYTRCN